MPQPSDEDPIASIYPLHLVGISESWYLPWADIHVYTCEV